MRRALTALALCGAAALPVAMTTPAGAVADTLPGLSYSIRGACPPGSNGGCWEVLTINSNPSNYNVRAFVQCYQGVLHYSAYAQRGTVSTPSCATSGIHFVDIAGFNLKPSPNTLYNCYSYFNDDPKSGTC